MQTALLLENIRSAENVGSIFRTADAAGISHIYLAGYTPAPLDKFKRPNKKIATRALGAELNIPWTSVEDENDIAALIKKMKKDGWQIIAIEQSPKAIDYKKVHVEAIAEDGGKTLFILGNEVEGVSPAMLGLCDIIAEIPMAGEKESLNVSVATGVALFRMLGL